MKKTFILANISLISIGFICLPANAQNHDTEIETLLAHCPTEVEQALKNNQNPNIKLSDQQQQVCGCLRSELDKHPTLKQSPSDDYQSIVTGKFTQCLAPEIGKQFTYNCQHNPNWIANAPSRGFNISQFNQFCQCMGNEFIPAMMREPNMPEYQSNQLTEACVRQAKPF